MIVGVSGNRRGRPKLDVRTHEIICVTFCLKWWKPRPLSALRIPFSNHLQNWNETVDLKWIVEVHFINAITDSFDRVPLCETIVNVLTFKLFCSWSDAQQFRENEPGLLASTSIGSCVNYWIKGFHWLPSLKILLIISKSLNVSDKYQRHLNALTLGGSDRGRALGHVRGPAQVDGCVRDKKRSVTINPFFGRLLTSMLIPITTCQLRKLRLCWSYAWLFDKLWQLVEGRIYARFLRTERCTTSAQCVFGTKTWSACSP